MLESSRKEIKAQNDISNKVVIPCCECEFAIYVRKDMFSGKQRWFCGNDIWQIGAFGDMSLMADNGCEFGTRKKGE